MSKEENISEYAMKLGAQTLAMARRRDCAMSRGLDESNTEEPTIVPFGDLADLDGSSPVTHGAAQSETVVLEERGIGTDLDASLRFAETHKDRVRYVPGR